MAKITLSNLKHSYYPNPTKPEDYALKEIDLDWLDGGAYALLGPSGCGKSTLLNIISGLLTPSQGRILFDDKDVTDLPPDQRNIAQVFQFPVIYDTMSVYDNLAFPLRNRGVGEATVDARVREIAQMLEVSDMLSQRGAGLSPDNKQKISMGRGLVRDDVNVVMFDEPLTVIDPHLKWKLRSKLKELHQKVRATMIYVTHDQTEALTFADQVVVMQEGEIVQIGTPVELFDRPSHTFVGHFIGSPGMNVLPCSVKDGAAFYEGTKVSLEGPIVASAAGSAYSTTQIGVRPEFVTLHKAPGKTGLKANVVKIADIGRHSVVSAMLGQTRVNAIVDGPVPEPGSSTYLKFNKSKTRLYRDGWIATEAPVAKSQPAKPKPAKPKATKSKRAKS